MTGLIVIFYSLIGTLAGGILCMIPALHIYNVAGILVIAWLAVRELIPYYALGVFFMSMVVAYSFINTIPMTFFNAADESAGASMLPSNDMFCRGRGKDATLLSGLGTLLGVIILLILTPFWYYIWSFATTILGPHLHWILGVVMVFYIMSEWPKGAGRGKNFIAKFTDAWRNVFAGMFTFTLSAILGLILTTKPLAPPELSFQNIMPIFVGFFAFPSIIQTVLSDVDTPKQYNSQYINADWVDFGYAALPGVIGGIAAAYLPAVTIGIAAIFASHFTNHRNLQYASMLPSNKDDEVIKLVLPEIYYRQERNFLIGGGIAKILYYVGAFLLLFVLTKMTPNGMGRGGLNVILRPIFLPEKGDYFVMISAILFSGFVSMLLLMFFTDLVVKYLHKINIKIVCYAASIALIIIIYLMGGGLLGLLVTAVTTCIGCIPVFYNCRRSHCMAVLLVPIALNMAGYGDGIAHFLHLV